MAEQIQNNSTFELSEAKQLIAAKKAHLSAVLQISGALTQNLSLKDLFVIYQDILINQLKIDKILFYVSQNNEWNCLCHYNTNPDNYDIQSYYDYKIAPKAGSSSLLKDFEAYFSIKLNNQSLAFVFLGGINNDKIESKNERLEFIKSLTYLMMTSIENKRLIQEEVAKIYYEKEISNATVAQMMLLPIDAFETNNLKAYFNYIPHKDIGGDYYDIFEIKQNRYAFCMCDVAGKGISAGLIMSNFQATFRIFAAQDLPIKELISTLNEKAYITTKGEKQITLIIGYIDLNTGTIEYINAGHNPAFLLKKGELIELDKGSTFIGMFDELFSIKSESLPIESGDVLFTYTDGLTDIVNEKGHEFTVDLLKQYVIANKDKEVIDFINDLHEYVYSYKNDMPYPDDISSMFIRIK
jgi:sigma-B regulation protein RsbU (phosphoserine phosphatase)